MGKFYLTQTSELIGNLDRYTTKRPSAELLERIQLAMLALMDEQGDEVMEIMRSELYGPVGVARNTFVDNFPTLDTLIYWSGREIKDAVAETARWAKEYSARQQEAGEKPVTRRQVIYRLLSWHNQNRTVSEFALRRFGETFWQEAMEPVAKMMFRFPAYFNDGQRAFRKAAFASFYRFAVLEWSREGFGMEALESCRNRIITHIETTIA